MYVEYAGTIAFNSESDAVKARETLKAGKWVKQIEDKLAYADDGGEVIDKDNMYTPDHGLVVYFNGGVLENLDRAVTEMLTFDVDREETSFAVVSFDGGVHLALYNKSENTINDLEEKEVKRILGYDPFNDEVSDETRADAEESGYDWATEYIVDLDSVRKA